MLNNHNESSDSVNKAKSKLKSGVHLGNAVRKAKEKGVLDVLFAGLSPSSLGVIGIIFLVCLFMVLVFSVVSPSTLFTTDAPKTQDIESSLYDGFDKTRRDAADYLVETLNNMYDCKATVDDLSYNKENGTYLLSNDYSELEINFYPGLSEFSEQIDSYANALNGVIALYQTDEKSKAYDDVEVNIDEKMTENGQLTEYGESFVDGLESEYLYSQSDSYFNSLSDYSEDMFSYEKDTSRWTFENIRKKYKTKYITHCYIENKTAGTKRPVACNLGHNCEEVEEIKTLATYGTVTVYMNCDPTLYKYDEYLATIEKATGSEMYKEVINADGTSEVKLVVLSKEDAKDVVDEVLNTYYFSYLSLYTGYDYGIGYPGKVTSNGWDYSIEVALSNSSAIEKYWSYSRGLNATLHSLKYRTDWSSGGPVMTNQCTQFAATFFYDVYGFAALRGDGVKMADYLVKDCGADSDAPVKFIRSMSVAPGAIVSLYPNHVIVIDEVDEDGTIYVSEGNVDDGKIRIHKKYEGGLGQYQRESGLRVKTIAIAIENPFE